MLCSFILCQTVNEAQSGAGFTCKVYLVEVLGSAVLDLPPLLEVRLCGVTGQRHVLELAASQLQELHGEGASQGTRSTNQEDVLLQDVLLQHPSQVVQSLLTQLFAN